MDKKTKFTIGFLVPNFLGEYFSNQCFILNQAAKEKNVNLIIFSPFLFLTEITNISESKKIFQFISKECIDGLIISTAALLSYYNQEEIINFFNKNSDLPVISLGEHIEGFPSVIIDNQKGMRKLVDHFIVEHGYKEIAFIRGTVQNKEAEMRFDAYKEVLGNHNISFNEKLVYQGDYGFHSGKQAVCNLLDKRGEKVQAIIAANDEMIMGAFTELQMRGIKVPDEIALGGFDNMKAIRETDIPITSVSQPSDDQMKIAIELLLENIAGRRIPIKTVLSARPVLRASCGCGGSADAVVIDQLPEKKEAFELRQGYDIGFLTEFTTQIMNSLTFDAIKEQCDKLLPKIDSTFCCIALYNCGLPLFINKDAVPPEISEIFFVYENKRLPVYEYTLKFKTKTLFPYLPTTQDSRHTYIFGELIFQKEHYGFFILEMERINPLVISLFKIQFANCLHNIYIHSVIENTNHELKKAKTTAESANKFKSRILANISHEIRTPMNAILGFINILMEQEEDQEKLDYMKIIRDSGNNLLNLINTILDLSTIESGYFKLENTIFNTYSMFTGLQNFFFIQAKEKGIEYKLKYNGTVPEFLIGDELRIRQVLVNIISNAIKFTNEGSVAIVVSYKNGQLVVDVWDTGIGIPPEKQEEVFLAFKQQDDFIEKKYGGTGLGLAISRSLVELMNGSIKLSSSVGIGSIFTLSIPLEISEIEKRYKQAFRGAKIKKLNSKRVIESWIEEKKLEKGLLPILYQAITSLPDKVYKLKQAVLNQHTDEAKFISHEIMGMAGNLAMSEIFQRVQIINDLVKKKPPVFEEIYFLINELIEFVENIPDEYLNLKDSSRSIMPGNNENISVLVADDNEINRKLVDLYLQELNITPVKVKDGFEVLSELEKIHFDLLLLDIQMPQLDGWEVLNQIKDNTMYQDLFIIAMTAQGNREEIDKLLESGCNDYIIKPLDKSAFKKKIENCLIFKLKKPVKKVIIEEAQKEQLKEIAEQLSKKAKIFNADDVMKIVESMESFKDISYIIGFQNRIKKAIAIFDCQALEFISNEIMELINSE